MNNMTTAERLRVARLNADLTVTKAAAMLDLHYESWARWERGVGVPSTKHLPDICALLGVSSDWLLGLD